MKYSDKTKSANVVFFCANARHAFRFMAFAFVQSFISL